MLVYKNFTVLFTQLENYEKALSYQVKALNIKKNKLGKMHNETGEAYSKAGAFEFNLGNVDKAEKLMK